MCYNEKKEGGRNMRYPLRDFTQKTRGVVLKQALELIDDQKVERIIKEGNHSHYHVAGDQQNIHHVEIVFEGAEIVFSHCDCTYEGVGLCKHVAGSLLSELSLTGFRKEMLKEEDFVSKDEDVSTKGNEDPQQIQALFEEMMHDTDFNFSQFINLQNKEGLQGFITKFMEQTEDIRMIMFAYLWYKKSTGIQPSSNVS
jgi:uncharacterized Zn finger protein